MKKIKISTKGAKGLFILNIVSFIFVFVLLQSTILITINFSIYYNVDKELKNYANNIENNITIEDNKVVLTKDGSNDSAVGVCVYKGDEKIPNILSNSIITALIPDLRTVDQFDDATEFQTYLISEITNILDKDILQARGEINKIKLQLTKDENGNEVNCRTLLINLPEDSSLYENGYTHAKLFVTVNGEVATRNLLVIITIIGIGALLLISMVTSYFLARTEIIPIKETLDKQLTFVNDASHELRTPLAIVQSKLESLLTEPNKTIIEASDDVAISLKEISRLKKLTDDLLQLARSDNKKVVTNFEECDLYDVVNEVSKEFKEIIEINLRRFEVNLEHVTRSVDKNQIHELLIILLDNALRYTQEGDTIELKLINSDSKAIIEVNDTGIGISDEGLTKVFERFYREDKARSRQTGGNGLGLSIALDIVKRHGGKIQASHNTPKGAKFTIKL